MRYSRALLLPLLILALGGCSWRQVSSGPRSPEDLAGRRTYGWDPAPREPAGDPDLDDPSLHRWIRAAAEEQLDLKGYMKRAAGAPDFLIEYSVAAQRQAGHGPEALIHTYGPRRASGREGQGLSAEAYDRGTLVLRVVEPGTKRRLWRGTAQVLIDPYASEQGRERRIHRAVRKMLERFPSRQ